jgi:pyruvate dehydrogenase E1 component
MKSQNLEDKKKILDQEFNEWCESLDYVIKKDGTERAKEILENLEIYAYNKQIKSPYTLKTPYINTISVAEQPVYPGNRELERKIKNIIRWNAMVMVLRANRGNADVGGHISTFASEATMLEVGFQHFFQGPTENTPGDLIYFQGHASPGVYARAFLEGRLTENQLKNFRRELAKSGGLSSYPHPRLMKDFWQFPTVSMGLGPIMAIYQARLMRYLQNRGIIPANDNNVWAFIGDGETDEPETLGAIHLASREKLDNLIFVINCNLQRLDGPVRGNSKIIQELAGIFQGANWEVIKVIWGSTWDVLFEHPNAPLLMRRMAEEIDGSFQKYSVEDGKYIRDHFFGKYPELLDMVKHFSDKDLKKLNRGGHDPEKLYAAFQKAVNTKDKPTVILAKSVKGYGLGKATQGKNITHQQKKIEDTAIQKFCIRFEIPISKDKIKDLPFYKPAADSPEIQYLQDRRKKLGGYLPQRNSKFTPFQFSETIFDAFFESSQGRILSSTIAFVRILTKMLKDKAIGKYIVPIVPDEARTFGMESLFSSIGIYSALGQLYEPVDKDSLLYYKESKQGQILEEGINEAGAMSSFNAVGTAYSNYKIPLIPFFIYYSMFGFQRIGDLAWAAGDMMVKGFMLGGTAGRTTLNGEGLQHQDGHSHVLASTIPNIKSYDPAFAYEVAVIIREGIKRMYLEEKNEFYYLTLENENIEMPAKPKGCEEGIMKGIYKLEKQKTKSKQKVHLLSSGSILPQCCFAARKILNDFGIGVDIWSVTSWTELRREGLEVERYNLLNSKNEKSYLTKCFEKEEGVIVAVSDYMKVLPDAIRQWLPLPMATLGTDGFGLSATREELREHFEISDHYVVWTAINLLKDQKQIDNKLFEKISGSIAINKNKINPMTK